MHNRQHTDRGLQSRNWMLAQLKLGHEHVLIYMTQQLGVRALSRSEDISMLNTQPHWHQERLGAFSDQNGWDWTVLWAVQL